MKKIFGIIFISLLVFTATLQAQVCPGVSVEAFPQNPPMGSYFNYGVRVTLSGGYNGVGDVTVTGYIYNVGSPNTNHPFSLTISGGNTAETAGDFYNAGESGEATAEISSVSPCPAFPLLNMSSGLLEFIGQKWAEINTDGEDICSQVNTITSDVTGNAGVLTYQNWVRFVQIGQAIDALNGVWNELYAAKMDAIISYAYSISAVNGANDEATRELVWDIIEENLFVIAEDKATACLEAKYSFNSLSKAIKEEEDTWLDGQTSEEFNPGDSPRFTEVLYDEEFWSLINANRAYDIENTDLEPEMLEEMPTEEQVSFIETIQEIVDILGGVVTIATELHGLFADCAGTTSVNHEDYKYGVKVPNEQSWVGYYIIQKGQAIDFANKTITKIKGKARLYKEKSNGKRKRDRKNRASIGFCAKEFNNCQSQDWPSDPGNYVSPHLDGQKGGRVKIKHREPKALAIEYSYHFLQFKFGKNGIYAGAINLLGNTGCTHASNTNW